MLLRKSVHEVNFLRENMSSVFRDDVDNRLIVRGGQRQVCSGKGPESALFGVDQKTGDIFEAITIETGWTMSGGRE